MANQFEKDAHRAKTRGFGGYMVDRALGRSDFDKSNRSVPPAPARTLRDIQIEDAERAALGMGHNEGPSMTDERRRQINSGN